MSAEPCALVWLDPGLTTGAVALYLDPEWLAGHQRLPAARLGGWLDGAWQFGRLPRRWSHTASKATVDATLGRVAGDAAPEWLRVAEHCARLLRHYPDAAWGYESWTPYGGARTADAYAPVRVESALICAVWPREPFSYPAAMAKSTGTDGRLSAAGLYLRGMPHATDAARGAFTFARAARANHSLRERAWPAVFGRAKRTG